jgi:carboxymethylenebutenolidase
MSETNGYIHLDVQGNPMAVYHCRSSSRRSRTLIVLQEAFGVNDHIKKVCERFAEQGYEVYAPELFHRFGSHLQFPYSGSLKPMELIKQLKEESVISDLEELLHYLEKERGTQISDVSVVGFCIGGYLAVLAGIKYPLKAIISFYGAGLVREREGFELKPLLPNFSRLKVPLLFFFGREDQSIPDADRRAIEMKLKELNLDAKVITYPDANHGFFCDHRSSYHAPSAKSAWEESLKWLDDCYSMMDRSKSIESGKWSSDEASS